MQNKYKDFILNLRWSPIVLNSPDRKSIKVNEGRLVFFANEQETIKEDDLLLEKVQTIILNSINDLSLIASEQTEDYLMTNGLDGGAPYLLELVIGGLSLKITSQVSDSKAHTVLQSLYESIEREILNYE